MSDLLDTAMKLLSERFYSEHELGKQLGKMFADKPDIYALIQKTLKRLNELHLINDHRLAEGIATRYTHKGNRFIMQALRQREVRDEVIEDVLAQLGDEYSRALYEARRKSRGLSGEHPEKSKTRVYRFLSGRGFAYETIQAVCKQLSKEGSLGSAIRYEEFEFE
ncbi:MULTISPECIES: regulatory protein RecX [Legionella]|uniref:Regulatory protein RecX n=2 Tax=Legionella TaxID=445 RepID=A0A0W0WRP4_9GAMM|nr:MULTISPECIES: regulatory protein RecX [Legionella]KTC76551.1 recombination regulator RecX [Legionella brunensis]KTD34997.1 recombination regulator RecX [Legionella nautarum]